MGSHIGQASGSRTAEAAPRRGWCSDPSCNRIYEEVLDEWDVQCPACNNPLDLDYFETFYDFVEPEC